MKNENIKKNNYYRRIIHIIIPVDSLIWSHSYRRELMEYKKQFVKVCVLNTIRNVNVIETDVRSFTSIKLISTART